MSDDMINHPPHYNHGKFETIKVIEDWGLDYHLGNCVKYISRAAHKGRELEDLKKARFYLDRKIESMETQSIGKPEAKKCELCDEPSDDASCDEYLDTKKTRAALKKKIFEERGIVTDDAESKQVQTVPTLAESSEQWTKESKEISDHRPPPKTASSFVRPCTKCDKPAVSGRTKCADHLPSPDPWERLTPDQKERYKRGLPINEEADNEEADNEEAKKAALYAKYGAPNFLGPSPNRPGYLRWAMCRKCKRPASPYSTSSEPRCTDHLEPNAENSR